MGAVDVERQSLNVFRMRLLGAKVVAVNNGSRTLKDAISEAMRDWTTNVRTTHYILGSVLGAHPYPMMIRDFQAVIGREARKQILAAEGKLPKLPDVGAPVTRSAGFFPTTSTRLGSASSSSSDVGGTR